MQGLFYLTTAIHVSGVTFTHLQEHKTTVTMASGNRYTVLFSGAIVEELELICVCCWCRCRLQQQHTQISSNSSIIAADNNTV
jgi:hypothetical protein